MHWPLQDCAPGPVHWRKVQCMLPMIGAAPASVQPCSGCTEVLSLSLACVTLNRSRNLFASTLLQVKIYRLTELNVVARDLRWAAQLLHRNVAVHGDEAMRHAVAEWEAAPRCFPLGNSDGTGITMGSSRRFPMYEGNDFGWGLPAAVRTDRANKFDDNMSAFPGRDLDGIVELEMCLAPETMAALLRDEEFMSCVSQ
ncbi:BAHD acyltransferase DCR-like [Canna indica]|uniref:BAHD acyltransferase DCR-like n=1 Tax=Canna indica TaxID=4628 RepID=A0AAQ3QCV7_9LILI|nr:BAHD acyltransferase DCR-like [Canna indica]